MDRKDDFKNEGGMNICQVYTATLAARGGRSSKNQLLPNKPIIPRYRPTHVVGFCY